MLEQLCLIRQQIKENNPLIHCLTNHITINDCANALLAVGARPIMAEHPLEVEQITSGASALSVNLGNINDKRMQSMLLSGQQASRQNIPCILDLVGVGCSDLRLNFARKFIEQCRPGVIKGNISEVRALLSGTQVSGVDVSAQDKQLTLQEVIDIARQAAQKYKAIFLLSGKVDVIADKNVVYLVDNGHFFLSLITGTGCVLNVLCAAFMSGGSIFKGVLAATIFFSVCGEVAATQAKGPTSFKTNLFDSLYNLSDETFCQRAKIKEVTHEKN